MNEWNEKLLHAFIINIRVNQLKGINKTEKVSKKYKQTTDGNVSFLNLHENILQS